MIVEPPDLPAARIGATVQREWSVDITSVDHVELGTDGWHWVLGDDSGPQWFATMTVVRTEEERRTSTAAYECAAQLTQHLSFVVAPVHTRDARVAVDLAPGLLLTVTPWLEGSAFGTGPFTDDAERGVVASMLGDLHARPRPRHLPVWGPRIGRRVQRADLERCLELDDWSGGPWSVPAGRLVVEARPVIRVALRRFALLAAAVAGNIDRWVITHGEPHTRHLLRTPDGPRLVDWSGLALAPRERDLGEPLGGAEGHAPWFDYLEAGGRPDPLSPDTVELFALQRHLSGIAEHAVRLSGPHEDTRDDRRCFGELEEQLGALLTGWG